MKGLAPLFFRIFGTFAFSWLGLTVIPNWQIGHLNPQSDEEGTDIYPQPQSGMFERGAHVYAANGCIYSHSQQVRADYAAADIERKWGNRRSAPRDYIFEQSVFLGKMRMGQDIANIGARAGGTGQPCPSRCRRPCSFAKWRNKSRCLTFAARRRRTSRRFAFATELASTARRNTCRRFAGFEANSEFFSCSTSWLACTSGFSLGTRRIGTCVSKFACTKSTSSSGLEGSSLFAVSVSNNKCKSGHSTKPGSRSTVARSNRWRATDV